MSWTDYFGFGNGGYGYGARGSFTGASHGNYLTLENFVKRSVNQAGYSDHAQDVVVERMREGGAGPMWDSGGEIPWDDSIELMDCDMINSVRKEALKVADQRFEKTHRPIPLSSYVPKRKKSGFSWDF